MSGVLYLFKIIIQASVFSFALLVIPGMQMSVNGIRNDHGCKHTMTIPAIIDIRQTDHPNMSSAIACE